MTYDAYQAAGTVDAGEAQGVDPLTEHQMAAIDPEKLQELGETLAARREIWITARAASGVEKRWLTDINQYNGRDDNTKEVASMMDAVERGFPVTNQKAKPQRSTVFVNITRSKTNAAEARVANMLCPVDDRNWGLKTTPNPELVQLAKKQAMALAQANQAAQQPPQQGQQQQFQPPQGGQPPSAPAPQMGAPAPPQQQAPAGTTTTPQAPNGQQSIAPGQSGGVSQDIQNLQGPYPEPNAQAILDEAERCVKAMQDEIDDQLVQSDYLGELRLMLHDCAVMGTGVIKGPIVVNRVRKAWQPVPGSQPVIHTLEMIEEAQPASERVDPWNLFPDPSCEENPHNGRGMFEKKTYTSKQLRELAKQPGYLANQISLVLEEGPQSALSNTRHDEQMKADSGNTEIDRDHYELWEYWGEFSPEDLRAAGVDVDDGSTEMISGCIVLVNKRVIKGYLNPIETGEIPYDFMVWEKNDGSVWGYGVPYLLRSPQRVLNAAWRQLMDNAGLSVGPNIVVDPTVIQPADQRWELTGRKIWNKVDSSVSAKDAFAVFNFESNIEDIQTIVKMAEEFADDTSSVQKLTEGEKGTAPDTVGGMTLLMNQSNVVLGRMVKQFDDNITKPHVRRYYDWNMAYNPNPQIKGDFQVDARGSSALLVRDMAHQSILGLGQYIANGTIAPMVNWEAWFKQMLKISRVDPTDIMKTEAQIAAISAQPPQATPEQIRAQAQLQIAKEKSQALLQVAQVKQQSELAYAHIEQQTAEQDASVRLQELQMKRDLAMLEYANQNKMQLQEIHAQLAQKQMDHSQERDLAASEQQMRSNEAQRARLHEANMQIHKTMGEHIENNADRSHESIIPVRKIQ